MEYCQTLLLQSSAEAQFTLCLFSPSASEPAGWSLCLFSIYVEKILAGFCKLTVLFPLPHCVESDVSVPSARVPSLGLVLLLLKNSTTDFFRYHDSHRQSLNKLERVEQLPPEELKEVYNAEHCFSLLVWWKGSEFGRHNVCLIYRFVCKAVPGSGVWFWWSGKDPISAEKRACQAPARPAGQQPSQTSCPLFLYPNTHRLPEKSRDATICFSK